MSRTPTARKGWVIKMTNRKLRLVVNTRLPKAWARGLVMDNVGKHLSAEELYEINPGASDQPGRGVGNERGAAVINEISASLPPATPESLDVISVRAEIQIVATGARSSDIIVEMEVGPRPEEDGDGSPFQMQLLRILLWRVYGKLFKGIG